jgi:hypothetical protein
MFHGKMINDCSKKIKEREVQQEERDEQKQRK